MAQKTVLECDRGNHMCKGDVVSYHVWRDGDVMSTRVDLCGVHDRPVRDLVDVGTEEPVPSKPRVAMEVTRLRPSKATAHLKIR